MVLVGLFGVLLAVGVECGRTANPSIQSAIAILLVGPVVATFIVKLIVQWLSAFKGISGNVVSTIVSTVFFVSYFGLAQSYYHPKLYEKIGFSTVAASFAPFVFVVSFLATWLFDFGFNGKSNSRDNAG